MPDGRIDDSVEPLRPCSIRDRVSDRIADRRVRIETGVAGRTPKIDELPSHAREHFGIFDDALQLPRSREELAHVMGDLAQAALDIERGIPGAAGCIEAVGFARLPIGEGGVDETRVSHGVNELAAADPLHSSALRQQAIAGRPFDFGERGGVLG
jgi:hypothetical protein